MTQPIKTIFAGTPEFAVPFLKSLFEDELFEVAVVITQPDKPSGRKQTIVPSPIKTFSQNNKLPVWQPENLKNENFLEKFKKIKPDLLVVVAYGLIIPQTILSIPRYGAINVHPSLLPKYRGASPIQNTILNGDKQTGITIMLMDQKMDHGPILSQIGLSLNDTETNESLHQTLAEIGPMFMIKTIKAYLEGSLKAQDQDHNQASFCQPIDKNEAQINWQLETAQDIERKIRAFYPWPVAWTIWNKKRIKIFPPVEITNDIPTNTKPGQTFISDGKLAIATKSGAVIINDLQLESKSKTSSQNFIKGYSKIISSLL